MGQELCEFDCESILQMLRETPQVADVIIEMIRDLNEYDESCDALIQELQRSQENLECA